MGERCGGGGEDVKRTDAAAAERANAVLMPRATPELECFSLAPSIDIPTLIRRPGPILCHPHPRQRGIRPQNSLHQKIPQFSARSHSPIMKYGQTQLYEIQITTAVCLPSSPASQNTD